MTIPLKLGIVGAGRMGITHFSIANAHQHAAITAIAEPSKLITKMIGKYTGVSTYKDYRGLLKGEELDGILVCTPPAVNPEILDAICEARIHAFVEKPFVLSSADGRRLASAFNSAGLVNQVGYVNRWNDMFRRAKVLLSDGVIGQPLRFRSEMFSPTIIRDPGDGGWRSTHANGGGAVFEMASHALDLIAFFFGPPDRVGGTSMTKVFSKRVEDVVSSTLLYDGGLSGTMYVNWSDASYRKPTNKFEVFGSSGKIQVDQHGMKIHLSEPRPEHGFKRGWNEIFITDAFSSVPFYVRGIEYTAQIFEFIDAIVSGGKSSCTFSDAAANLEVIEKLFEDCSDNLEGASK